MISAAVLLLASTLHRHGPLPDAMHAWSVHDEYRPNPVKVCADEGKPPSDAVVLFDGTGESVAANWCDGRGNPTKWKAENGCLVCVPGSGYIVSKEQFADCQLHVEWKAPTDETTLGQDRGNSGVFLAGKYEVQVLESFGTNPADMKNPNYADGQAGALYGQHPPMVNPARKEGVWQSYDIVFHPGVWDGDVCVHRPTMTVLFNGVLVQDNWELEGPTDWMIRARQEKVAAGPIMLQDHGHPVPYRNVWVRRIPSRYADNANGGVGVVASAVARQRQANGAARFAEVRKGVFTAVNAQKAIEAVAYDPAGVGYVEAMNEICDGLAKVYAAMSDQELADNRDDINCLHILCGMMVWNGSMKGECPLVTALNAARDRLSGKK